MARSVGYVSLTPSTPAPQHEDVPLPRKIALVVFDGLQPLDLVGPFEVFAGANSYETAHQRPAPYEVSVVAAAATGPGRRGTTRR